MLCNGGVGNGKQIVPLDWIDDTLDANPDIFHEPYNLGITNGAYRNQFWIRDVDRKVMMARGVFGQLIYIDIDNRLTITRLASWPEFLSTERKLDDYCAIDAITKHLTEVTHE